MVPEDAVNLTTEDMQANAAGLLSSAQKQILYRRRLLFLAGSLGLVGILAALLVVLFLKRSMPSFASRGELFIWLPVGLFWLWLLRDAPLQLRRTTLDLRAGRTATVEGRALLRWGNTFGLIQFPKYEVQVAGAVFALSHAEYFQFSNRGSYQIIYAPRSNVFLGALPIPETQDAATGQARPGGAGEELSHLLNDRELEILKLQAEGLSNKEIAAQLSLSVNTVKMYASQTYKKMGVSRRTEAIALARRHGIL